MSLRSPKALLASVLLLTSVLLGTACGELPDDAEDAAFLTGGLAEDAGIEEGSPEAEAVLALVNEASFEMLTTEVGLSSRAARAIVDHRERHGAPGDGPRLFRSLTSLDAVPFVGSVTFGKLLAYVRAHGDVGVPERVRVENG